MSYRTAPQRRASSVLVVCPQRGPSSLTAMVVAGIGGVCTLALAFRFAELFCVFLGGVVTFLWLGLAGRRAWCMRVEVTRRADAMLQVAWCRGESREERTLAVADVLDVRLEESGDGSRLVLLLAAERVEVARSTAVEGLGRDAEALRRFVLEEEDPCCGDEFLVACQRDEDIRRFCPRRPEGAGVEFSASTTRR